MSASHRMRTLSFVIATVLTAGLAAGTAHAATGQGARRHVTSR